MVCLVNKARELFIVELGTDHVIGLHNILFL